MMKVLDEGVKCSGRHKLGSVVLDDWMYSTLYCIVPRSLYQYHMDQLSLVDPTWTWTCGAEYCTGALE